MEFIDGSTPEPAKINPTYQVWKRCNNMIISWLTHPSGSNQMLMVM